MRRFHIIYSDGRAEHIDAHDFNMGVFGVSFYSIEERASKAWNAKNGDTVEKRSCIAFIAGGGIAEIRELAPL